MAELDVPTVTSYHGGHSKEYCCHATDALADILDTYVASGFRYVAVTEHLPSRKGYLYPDEEAVGYEELARRFHHLMEVERPILHKRYDPMFTDFRVGFETEFYGTDRVSSLRKAIRQFEPDIVVASLHHVRDTWIYFEPEQYKDAVRQ